MAGTALQARSGSLVIAPPEPPPFRWKEPNCGRHFKSLAEDVISIEISDTGPEPGTWSLLDKAEQAVLPVLLRHTDQKGFAYPGEHRLAAMSGFKDRKTVRKATRNLEKHALIKIDKITSRTGHRLKRYDMTKVLDNGSGINIPSIQIDGGNWACLLPAAKSLAMVIWYFAKPRPDLDPDHNGERWVEGDDLTDYLTKRKVDFCDAEPSVLREFSNVSRRAYSAAIDSLIEHNIIKPHPDRPDGWMVYVMPPMIKKTSYLNDKYGRGVW